MLGGLAALLRAVRVGGLPAGHRTQVQWGKGDRGGFIDILELLPYQMPTQGVAAF